MSLLDFSLRINMNRILFLIGFLAILQIGSFNEICEQEPETGLCDAYIPRFYYDSASRTCKTFIYGGCHGNENNFKTEESCVSKCSGSKRDAEEDCSLEPVTGPCRAYFKRFYYDATSQSCKKFVYGGCRGNANNFQTEEECHASCASSKLIKREVDCIQEPETGPCRGYFERFYYDASSQSCKTFVYGGCLGNSNNFQTEQECHATCAASGLIKREEDVCQLEPKTGMCMAYFPRYYFDHVSGTCRQFIYGGCGDNGNNFKTEEICMKSCSH